tara:strand:+ start:598 stop:1113 length:516 start_codon:yes stop_codon:yes gene_type:complete
MKLRLSKKAKKKYKIEEVPERTRKAYGVCEHDMVNYKALDKMNHACFKIIKRLTRDIDFKNHWLGKYSLRCTEWQEAWDAEHDDRYEAEADFKKRLEDAQKQITKYKQMYLGMKGLKQSAEAMGIDTENYVPTEADKKFQREHEYSEKHTQLESGKVSHSYLLKKKKKKLN